MTLKKWPTNLSYKHTKLQGDYRSSSKGRRSRRPRARAIRPQRTQRRGGSQADLSRGDENLGAVDRRDSGGGGGCLFRRPRAERNGGKTPLDIGLWLDCFGAATCSRRVRLSARRRLAAVSWRRTVDSLGGLRSGLRPVVGPGQFYQLVSV